MVPLSKDEVFWGSILRSPYFGKLTHIPEQGPMPMNHMGNLTAADMVRTASSNLHPKSNHFSAKPSGQVRPAGVKEGSHVRANECGWADP